MLTVEKRAASSTRPGLMLHGPSPCALWPSMGISALSCPTASSMQTDFNTLPETNIAPENWGPAYIQVLSLFFFLGTTYIFSF